MPLKIIYCPDCYIEMDETELNTFTCPQCGEEWDIDELRELEDEEAELWEEAG